MSKNYERYHLQKKSNEINWYNKNNEQFDWQGSVMSEEVQWKQKYLNYY